MPGIVAQFFAGKRCFESRSGVRRFNTMTDGVMLIVKAG